MRSASRGGGTRFASGAKRDTASARDSGPPATLAPAERERAYTAVAQQATVKRLDGLLVCRERNDLASAVPSAQLAYPLSPLPVRVGPHGNAADQGSQSGGMSTHRGQKVFELPFSRP